MELELGQLELRYERLRTRSVSRERRLLAAIAEVGQQTPIIVVLDGGRWVVVDGYKRVRAVRRLGRDTVLAVSVAFSSTTPVPHLTAMLDNRRCRFYRLATMGSHHPRGRVANPTRIVSEGTLRPRGLHLLVVVALLAMLGCRAGLQPFALAPSPAPDRVRIVPQTRHASYDGSKLRRCAVLAPDGQLYTAATDGMFRRWDAQTGVVLEATRVPVSLACAFSRDGRYLIGATHDGRVTVVSTARREVVRSFEDREASTVVGVAQDAPVVAAITARGRLLAWNLETGDSLSESQLLEPEHHSFSSIDVSPDGTHVAIAYEPGLEELARLEQPGVYGFPLLVATESGRVTRRLSSYSFEEWPTSVVFTPDSQHLLVGPTLEAVLVGTYSCFVTQSCQDSLFDREDWKTITGYATLRGQLMLSPAGDKLAIGDQEISVGGMDPNADAQPHKLACAPFAFGSGVTVCDRMAGLQTFLGSVSDYVSGPYDFHVAGSHGPSAVVSAPPTDVVVGTMKEVAFSPDGRWLHLADNTNQIWAWDLDTLSIGRDFDSTTGRAQAFALSPDGRSLLAKGVVHDLGGKRAPIALGGAHASAWAPTGGWIATGDVFSAEGRIAIFQDSLPPGESERVQPTQSIEGRFDAFAFRPGRDQLLALQDSSGADRLLSLFDVRTGVAVSQRKIDQAPLALVMNPDGATFFAAFEQPSVYFTDDKETWTGRIAQIRFEGLEDEKTFAEHGAPVMALAVDGKGAILASGGIDGVVRLWNVESGERVDEIATDGAAVTAIAFSPGSELLAVGRNDGVTHLYRLADKKRLTLLGHQEWIAFDDEGHFDASMGGTALAIAVTGDRPQPLESVAATLNRADLVMGTIGLGPPTVLSHLRESAARRQSRLGPKSDALKIVSSTFAVRGKVSTVKFTVSGGEATSYNVYVNGVPILGRDGATMPSGAATAEGEFELQRGENRVEIAVASADGGVARSDVETLHYTGEVERDLYYVGFGVSNYADPTLHLDYTTKDVADLAKSLTGRRFDHTYTLSLLDGDVSAAGFERVREFLRPSHADDVVVFFLAGHGEQIASPTTHYGFFPANVSLDDLAGTTIPLDSFETLFDATRSRYRVFFIDTCESGEDDQVTPSASAPAKPNLVRRGSGRRRRVEAHASNPAAAQPADLLPMPVSRLPRLADADIRRRTGAVVLSSSRANESSFERSDLAHGVFTEALIQGLENGQRSVDGLRAHAAEVVPTLTFGAQHPTIDRDNLSVRFEPLF